MDEEEMLNIIKNYLDGYIYVGSRGNITRRAIATMYNRYHEQQIEIKKLKKAKHMILTPDEQRLLKWLNNCDECRFAACEQCEINYKDKQILKTLFKNLMS